MCNINLLLFGSDILFPIMGELLNFNMGGELQSFLMLERTGDLGFWYRIMSTTGGKLELRLGVQQEEKWCYQELDTEFSEISRRPLNFPQSTEEHA